MIRDQTRRFGRIIDELVNTETRIEGLVGGLGASDNDRLLLQTAFTEESLEEGEKRFETCMGHLMTLRKEGVVRLPQGGPFRGPDEMSKGGYHYDRSAVAHTLVDSVREGSLFRHGSTRNYGYGAEASARAQCIGRTFRGA